MTPTEATDGTSCPAHCMLASSRAERCRCRCQGAQHGTLQRETPVAVTRWLSDGEIAAGPLVLSPTPVLVAL